MSHLFLLLFFNNTIFLIKLTQNAGFSWFKFYRNCPVSVSFANLDAHNYVECISFCDEIETVKYFPLRECHFLNRTSKIELFMFWMSWLFRTDEIGGEINLRTCIGIFELANIYSTADSKCWYYFLWRSQQFRQWHYWKNHTILKSTVWYWSRRNTNEFREREREKIHCEPADVHKTHFLDKSLTTECLHSCKIKKMPNKRFCHSRSKTHLWSRIKPIARCYLWASIFRCSHTYRILSKNT